MSKVDPAFSGEPARRVRRSRARTLEFDLGLNPPRKARVSAPKRAAEPPAADSQPVSAPRTEPPAFRSGRRREALAPQGAGPADERAPFSEPQPDPVIQPSALVCADGATPDSEPVPKEPAMNPTQPAPLNVKKTIERQSREQHAMSHLLNGVAISFVCAIVLVASLAGLGGYVLYKQLMNQSATIALLETNTLERFAELEGRLAARNRELAEAQQEANLRLTNLQGQFEQYRSQTTQSISLLTSANARLERRLAEYRQELLRQEQLLSLNEAPARRLR